MWRLKIFGMTVLLSVLAVAVMGQDSKEQRKKERKELKARRAEETKQQLIGLTENKSLLLDADALRGRYSGYYNVGGENFILIDGDRFVLQTASAFRSGYNGLGGVTLEGTITSYEYNIDKDKGSIVISARVNMPVGGPGSLLMQIAADGSANATYRDNWGGRITFVGNIHDPADTRFFEGMKLI